MPILAMYTYEANNDDCLYGLRIFTEETWNDYLDGLRNTHWPQSYYFNGDVESYWSSFQFMNQCLKTKLISDELAQELRRTIGDEWGNWPQIEFTNQNQPSEEERTTYRVDLPLDENQEEQARRFRERWGNRINIDSSVITTTSGNPLDGITTVTIGDTTYNVSSRGTSEQAPGQVSPPPGIDVSPIRMDWSRAWPPYGIPPEADITTEVEMDVNDRFDLSIIRPGLPTFEHSWSSTEEISQFLANASGWSNPEIDAFLSSAMMEPEVNERYERHDGAYYLRYTPGTWRQEFGVAFQVNEPRFNVSYANGSSNGVYCANLGQRQVFSLIQYIGCGMSAGGIQEGLERLTQNHPSLTHFTFSGITTNLGTATLNVTYQEPPYDEQRNSVMSVVEAHDRWTREANRPTDDTTSFNQF